MSEALKVHLASPSFDEEMKQAAIQALENERFVLGESVYKFEEEFARYCGAKFAVSTASGTAALTLSLIALGVGQAEVLTSPASFVASANCIIHAGAVPKFADISLQTYTMDPAKTRSSMNRKTKALLPVHLYGFPAAMEEICEIASKHNASVIEDACQAHGAIYHGRRVGALGDAGCFSFYPSKNMMVGGDGGMVVTNDEAIAERVTSLRDCGRVKGSKYTHDKIGFTERLNTVQAAIGRVQLKRLDAWNEERGRLARMYGAILDGIRQVTPPPAGDSKVRPVYHMYVIRCERRDGLRSSLAQAGIETGIHYTYPIHLQPIYREVFRYKGGEFPNSEKLCREALSIPLHPDLTDNDVRFVCESIKQFYS